MKILLLSLLLLNQYSFGAIKEDIKVRFKIARIESKSVLATSGTSTFKFPKSYLEAKKIKINPRNDLVLRVKVSELEKYILTKK